MMKKIFLLALSLVLITFPAIAQEKPEMTPELETFSHKIVAAFASGEKDAYMGILHPDCPAPVEARMDWQLSSKWKPDTADIRLRNLAAAYDRNQLEFQIEPEEYVIEFQVMTVKPDGSERELVTNYPVAIHEGELKILDFPCFGPK